MCFQVLEQYASCRCLYYQHAVDRCAGYGRPGHSIQLKTLYIGYECSAHSATQYQHPDASRHHPGQTDEDDSLSESDGEETENSDEDTAASVASSKTSIYTDGAELLDTVFNMLCAYGELRYVWPQVVCRHPSPKGAYRTVMRFLDRYSADLRTLASEPGSTEREKRIRTIAGRVFRQHQSHLARRICEIDSNQPAISSTVGRVSDEKAQENQEEARVEDLLDQYTSEVALEFLFGTPPIRYLEAGVKAFLLNCAPAPALNRLASQLRVRFANITESFTRPPTPLGCTRFELICVCGQVILDDYPTTAYNPTSSVWNEPTFRLLNALESYIKNTKAYTDLSSDGERTSSHDVLSFDTWQNLAKRSYSGCLAAVGLIKQLQLPLRRQDIDTSIPAACTLRDFSIQGTSTHCFVLLCVPFMRSAMKLFQTETCVIHSDRDFFWALRRAYPLWRGRGAMAWLRKVRSLHFVQLEVFHGELVDIRESPSMPPPNSAGYSYEPGSLPPVGSNLLAHLFEYPDHAAVTPTLYRRMPKKLESRLSPCPQKGSSIGWGIQIVEGLDWFALFVVGVTGFAICLIAALAWTFAQNDIQGGFAIGSFMFAFMVFCNGLVHLETTSS